MGANKKRSASPYVTPDASASPVVAWADRPSQSHVHIRETSAARSRWISAHSCNQSCDVFTTPTAPPFSSDLASRQQALPPQPAFCVTRRQRLPDESPHAATTQHKRDRRRRESWSFMGGTVVRAASNDDATHGSTTVRRSCKHDDTHVAHERIDITTSETAVGAARRRVPNDFRHRTREPRVSHTCIPIPSARWRHIFCDTVMMLWS